MEILDAWAGSFVRQTIRNPVADAFLTPKRSVLQTRQPMSRHTYVLTAPRGLPAAMPVTAAPGFAEFPNAAF